MTEAQTKARESIYAAHLKLLQRTCDLFGSMLDEYEDERHAECSAESADQVQGHPYVRDFEVLLQRKDAYWLNVTFSDYSRVGGYVKAFEVARLVSLRGMQRGEFLREFFP